MTGVKGRSGKATTLEAKLAKAAGGRKAGRGRPLGQSPPSLPPAGAIDPTSDDADARLGKPLTWGDELKRQQVEGERIQNRRREVEVQRAEVELNRAREEADEASGRRLSKDKHRESVAAIVGEIVDAASSLLTAAVSLHPPERQPQARHQMEIAINEWRRAAAERIKAL